MARKPIQIERTGLRTPRERMWTAMLKLGRFQAVQLHESANPATPRTVQSYLECLSAGGYISALDDAPAKYRLWEVIKRQPRTPMLDRQGQEIKPAVGTLAMWRAMKVRKVFDAAQIATDATQGGVTCSLSTTKAYVAVLLRCGYLRVDVKSTPNTLARLRLIKDTGPLPPAITRAKALFDRNTGELLLAQTAQEVGDVLDR